MDRLDRAISSDRVVERFWIISQRKPTDANCIGSFAPENGPSAKGTVGEYSKGSAARSGHDENDGLNDWKAHLVSISPQKDRGCSKSEVGEVEDGSEEVGVAVLVASPALFQGQCRTPRQPELANAMFRYLEMARPV